MERQDCICECGKRGGVSGESGFLAAGAGCGGLSGYDCPRRQGYKGICKQ